MDEKIGFAGERAGSGWERMDEQRRELAMSRKLWVGKERVGLGRERVDWQRRE